MNAKRRVKEARVANRPLSVADSQGDLLWRDLLPVLDLELQALPAKYRAPIVLCDLEGKARKVAARQLGWPEGTLSSRLALGRRMLARRLSRRGVSLHAALLPLTQSLVADVVPMPLLTATVKAGLLVAKGMALSAPGISASAAALADGVLKAMLLAKLKVSAAVQIAVVFVFAGTGLLWECPRPQAKDEVASPYYAAPQSASPEPSMPSKSIASRASEAQAQPCALPSGAEKPAPPPAAHPQKETPCRLCPERRWAVAVCVIDSTKIVCRCSSGGKSFAVTWVLPVSGSQGHISWVEARFAPCFGPPEPGQKAMELAALGDAVTLSREGGISLEHARWKLYVARRLQENLAGLGRSSWGLGHPVIRIDIHAPYGHDT
jgi:hypothetical protein